MKRKFPSDLGVDKLLSEPACWAPWMTIYTKNATNIFAPCCVSDTKLRFDSINDYLQSDFFREITQSLKDGSYHPKHCNQCIKHTSIGRKPDSEHYNITLTDLSADDFDSKKKYLLDKDRFIYLDLRPGNLCNLKCRTCNPSQSSEIAKEMVTYKKFKDSKRLEELKRLAYRYTQNDVDTVYWEELLSYFTLNFFKAIGGEPSIDPHVYNILNYILEHYKEKPILHITTNVTNVNNRWINLLKEFPRLRVNFSIDGAGEIFEYIRHPAKWDIIKKAVYNQLNIERKNINVVITNLLLLTIENWIGEFSTIISKDMDITYIKVQNKGFLTLNCLPEYLITERIQAIHKLSLEYPNLKKKLFDPLLLDLEDVQEDIYLLDTFFKKMEALDSIRKQDLYSLSPKFVELKRYVDNKIKTINN
jgi:hypothetical protein